jgi:hypothetical protein
MQVLGSESFLSIPDVNGQPVLMNGGNTGSVATGTLAARPVASTAGNLYVDTTSNIIWRDTGIAWVQLGASSSGAVLQVVTGTIPATSGTTVIPLDNTIPTSTEGIQIFTRAFTPVSATSTVIVSYSISVNTNTNNVSVATCVFSGTTNLGAAVVRCATSSATAGTLYSLTNQVSFLPGSTATITISARTGPLASSTCYINSHATAFFGGALVTDYTIMEIV